MIRSLTLLLVTIFVSQAARPPVPDVGHEVKKREILNSCKVPAQIVVLPPMVENDYRECVNRYYMPDVRVVAYSIGEMLKKNVEVKRLAIADDFIRAYEVDIVVDKKPKRLLCDEKVNRCFEITNSYRKDKK